MSEDSEESWIWEEEDEAYSRKRQPWKKPKKPYETDIETEKGIKQQVMNVITRWKNEEFTWDKIYEDVQKLPPYLQTEIATLWCEVIRRREARDKYPETEIYPKEMKTLVAKALTDEKLTLAEIQNLPPEIIQKRQIQAMSYSPLAEQFVGYVKSGFAPNQIPSTLLRAMTPQDFQESERLLKESQNTSKPLETMGLSWEQIHKLKRKLTGTP
jgi:hypothetical protein